MVIEVSGPVRLGRPLRATIREELGQIGGVGVTEELEDGNRYAICLPKNLSSGLLSIQNRVPVSAP